MLSMSGRGEMSLLGVGGIRFDIAALTPPPERHVQRQRRWARPLRRSLGLPAPADSLLAGVSGVWAWKATESYAPAHWHPSVQHWIEANPGCDVRLWIAGGLMHGLDSVAADGHRHEEALRLNARQELVRRHGDRAATWPLAMWKNEAARGVFALAGIDLDSIRQHAARNRVRVQSVAPWWYHAFLEAGRCVPAVLHAPLGQVCVVEGTEIAWIATDRGSPICVHQRKLHRATVAELNAAIAQLDANGDSGDALTVVVGQGLIDGGETRDVQGLVLGRLDGDQPPQWLRPGSQFEAS